MNGHVDDSLRALLEVRVGNTPSEQSTTITVWIDTAFDGFLVFSKSLIESLNLDQEAAADAILADGSRMSSRRLPVAFVMFAVVCHIHRVRKIRLPVSRVLINEQGKRRPLSVGQRHDCQHRVVAIVDAGLQELIEAVSVCEDRSKPRQLRHVVIVLRAKGTPLVGLVVQFAKRHVAEFLPDNDKVNVAADRQASVQIAEYGSNSLTLEPPKT